MIGRVVVSVPGKLILMGEHAAVYRRPALVAAVGLRSRVELRRGGGGVEIDLPDLGHRSSTDWGAIRSHATAVREAWRRYVEEPSMERFAKVWRDDPAHLIKVALGEVMEELGRDTEELPGLGLHVASELPLGAGFGSSAATAVGVVAAAMVLLGEEAAAERVDRLAMAVERRQHGLPSGVDHRTVQAGGLLWARRREDGELESERVVPAGTALEALEIYHTGTPAEATGEVVAAVRRRRERSADRYAALLDRMERGVREFRELVTGGSAGGERLRELVRDYQACLEEMGVVPEPVRRAVKEVEAAGGAAKISGAGALSGAAAGCLLVYPPAGETVSGSEALAAALATYTRHRVALGVEGLRVEIRE